MIEALLVFVAMFFQDVAAAAKINYLRTGRPWRAGLMEAANDVGASLSVGFAGATVVRYGISTRTLQIECALAGAAILGTRLGDWLTKRKRA